MCKLIDIHMEFGKSGFHRGFGEDNSATMAIEL